MTTENEEQIKVIGAGFGRTGTDSLREALNDLGYKCYHMHELKQYMGDPSNDDKILYEIVFKNNAKGDWDKLYKPRNYSANVDFPTSRYYFEMLKQYPNAKVILTVRDANRWYDSVKGSIYLWHALRQRWFYTWGLIPALRIHHFFTKNSKNDKHAFVENTPEISDIINDVIWGSLAFFFAFF